jgi:hypothetical protein
VYKRTVQEDEALPGIKLLVYIISFNNLQLLQISYIFFTGFNKIKGLDPYPCH